MPHGLSSGKEVAESALEALLTEVAAHYTRPGAPLPARAALESLGFQVGLQLVERCVRPGLSEAPVGNAAVCETLSCACRCAAQVRPGQAPVW
jgi:hypothetical protein